MVKIIPFLEKAPKITAKKLELMKKEFAKKERELDRLVALIEYGIAHLDRN